MPGIVAGKTAAAAVIDKCCQLRVSFPQRNISLFLLFREFFYSQIELIFRYEKIFYVKVEGGKRNVCVRTRARKNCKQTGGEREREREREDKKERPRNREQMMEYFKRMLTGARAMSNSKCRVQMKRLSAKRHTGKKSQYRTGITDFR